MGATIINYASKTSVRTVRSIIARYQGLAKERAPSHKQCPLRLCLISLRPERRQTFWFYWWFKVQMHFIQRQCCILTTFMLVVKSACVFFPSTDMFYPRNNFICASIAWMQLWFSISHICEFKRLLHQKCQLDFHTIYRKWPAAYTLYIHSNLCKLNECI